MTDRAPFGRRVAASLLGVERSGRAPAELAARRRLPFRRRLLAAVLGVPVGPGSQRHAPVPEVSVTERTAHASVPAPTPAPAPAPKRKAAPGPTPEPYKAVALATPGATTGPQYLLGEDRVEYERLLDEALRSAPHRPELAAVGQRLNAEQLRTMALSATALITAAAATEYQHYVSVRERLRSPAPLSPPPARASGSKSVGAGAVAVVAVLGPVLAGTAAAIFLLVGFLLKLFDPDPRMAEHMIVTGWVFGAVTAVSILAAAVWLLVTALRNQPSSAAGSGELSAEVAVAREAWRHALLERGILPFLREALADPGSSARHRTSSPTSRVPHLGHSTPDFTGPDLSGPEHQPDGSPAGREQQAD